MARSLPLPPRDPRPTQTPAGFPYIGAYRYFLTLCTVRRTHVFVTNERVALVLEQIQRGRGA